MPSFVTLTDTKSTVHNIFIAVNSCKPKSVTLQKPRFNAQFRQFC